MSRSSRRKRHPFLKAVLVILILGILGLGLFAFLYPGSPLGRATNDAAGKAAEKAKEAKPVVEDWARNAKEAVEEKLDSASVSGRLESTDDIDLRSAGDGWNYYFTYNGEDYRASYTDSTWTIYDSYKITNKKDMKIICQALIGVYPVPSRDWQSYRTADDMAYEWDQHNKIYLVAPEGSATKERTRNVDLDPADQGKSYKDLYEENLGH